VSKRVCFRMGRASISDRGIRYRST
jgi:hypothetical protein